MHIFLLWSSPRTRISHVSADGIITHAHKRSAMAKPTRKVLPALWRNEGILKYKNTAGRFTTIIARARITRGVWNERSHSTSFPVLFDAIFFPLAKPVKSRKYKKDLIKDETYCSGTCLRYFARSHICFVYISQTKTNTFMQLMLIRSFMPVLVSMLMSHTALHFFVLSFVLACAWACVASEHQSYKRSFSLKIQKTTCILISYICHQAL